MNFVARDKTILDMCRGKKVLHLGCVGFADLATEERVNRATQSLHYALTAVADVTGIDYSSDAVKYFRDEGIFTNVVVGNAERLGECEVSGRFDVIVAGDIIEHLSNPGLMLDGLKRFSGPDTRLLITTPHAFGFLSFLRFISGKFREGAEHVMTFNGQNLGNLLVRHGFSVISIDTCYQSNATQKPLFILGKSFFREFPKLGGTLFVVAATAPLQ